MISYKRFTVIFHQTTSLPHNSFIFLLKKRTKFLFWQQTITIDIIPVEHRLNLAKTVKKCYKWLASCHLIHRELVTSSKKLLFTNTSISIPWKYFQRLKSLKYFLSDSIYLSSNWNAISVLLDVPSTFLVFKNSVILMNPSLLSSFMFSISLNSSSVILKYKSSTL